MDESLLRLGNKRSFMFKYMNYVYAVYLNKSFSKAAEKLYISQPALSAAIKKVEEEIGLPIFDRPHLPPTNLPCNPNIPA